MSADTGFIIGYGSWCKLGVKANNEGFNAGVTVPILSGSYSRKYNVPMQNTFSLPFNDSPRSSIRTGQGTISFSGSISFEMTSALNDVFFQKAFFKRKGFIDIDLCDGMGEIKIENAVWNSFSLSGSVGNLISGSLGFLSCNNYNKDISVTNPKGVDIENFNLSPYWQYGGDGMESFDLNINRSVVPVYLNQKTWIGPAYLMVGMTDATINVKCWEKWFLHRKLIIGNKQLIFKDSAFLSDKNYSFGNAGSESVKSYAYTAVGMNSHSELFEIQ